MCPPETTHPAFDMTGRDLSAKRKSPTSCYQTRVPICINISKAMSRYIRSRVEVRFLVGRLAGRTRVGWENTYPRRRNGATIFSLGKSDEVAGGRCGGYQSFHLPTVSSSYTQYFRTRFSAALKPVNVYSAVKRFFPIVVLTSSLRCFEAFSMKFPTDLP